MEISYIKSQLHTLQDGYLSDTTSHDDIVYAAYKLVKSAHEVSDMLLVKGRLPELRRCLDMCRCVLEEKHVAKGGRIVLGNATGDDRQLMDSLLKQTTILEERYEAARALDRATSTFSHSHMIPFYKGEKMRSQKNRDKNYFSSSSTVQRPVSPPERGNCLSNRTWVDSLAVRPVLPPLVTQKHLFLPNFVETQQDLMQENLTRRQEEALTRGSGSDSLPPLTPASAHESSLSHPSSTDSALCPFVGASKVEHRDDMESTAPSSLDAAWERAFRGFDKLNEESARASRVWSLHTRRITGERSSFNSVLPGIPRHCSVSNKTVATDSPAESGTTKPPESDLSQYYTSCNGSVETEERLALAARAVRRTAETVEHASFLMEDLGRRTSILTGRKYASSLEMSYEFMTHSDDSGSQWMGDTARGSLQLNSVFATSSLGMFRESLSTPNSRFVCSVNAKGTFEPGASATPSTPSKVAEGNEASGSADVRVYKWEKEATECGELWLPAIVVPGWLSSAAQAKVDEMREEYENGLQELNYLSERMRSKAMEHIESLMPKRNTSRFIAALRSRTTRELSFSDSCRNTVPGETALQIASVSAAAYPCVLQPSTDAADGRCVDMLPESTGTEGGSPSREFGSSSKARLTSPMTRENRLKFHLDAPNNTCSTEGLASETSSQSATLFAHSGDTDRAFCDVKGAMAVSSPLLNGSTGALTLLEKRLSRLKAVGGLFPEVHQMVIKHIEEMAKRERDVQRCVQDAVSSVTKSNYDACLSSGSAGFSSTGHSNYNDKSHVCSHMKPIALVRKALNRFALQGVSDFPSSSVYECTDPGAITRNDMSSDCGSRGMIFLFHGDNCDMEANVDAQPFIYSIEELHMHPDWTRIDGAILSLILPLQIASVRIQRAARSFAALRNLQRRSEAMHTYINTTLLREESLLVIQQYFRASFARRHLCLHCASGYNRRQRQFWKGHGTNGEYGVAKRGFRIAMSPHGEHRHSAFNSPISSERRRASPAKTDAQATPTLRELSIFSRSSLSTSNPNLIVPADRLRWPKSSSSTSKLQRIREMIACRVIVRALRVNVERKWKLLEEEARSYLCLLTGKVTRNSSAANSPPKVSAVEGNVVKFNYFGSVSDESRSFSDPTLQQPKRNGRNDFGVFPVDPARICGDAVAAWELRMSAERKSGNIMTPLEHVKLSDLQRHMRERKMMAAQKRIEEEEQRLAEELDIQRQQQKRMQAILLLQRCTRGYVVRRSLIQVHKRFKQTSMSHCKTGSFAGGKGVSNSVMIYGEQFAHDCAVTNRHMHEETRPIPLRLSCIIEQDISRRYPLWAPGNNEVRTMFVKAITMVQAVMRQFLTRRYTAERYVHLCAKVIQRRWRVVRLRRRSSLTHCS
ncbi:IQ calmodulin binding motif [Trypanosoma vivax]|uniref:Uncharacterized protein n=1 Tax=Trypanosoma vivax (strain Y486) TaxID=1055687 RepID=G0U278_TRYVY|nr:hypothetical protein TRVL_01739 [Trypanosoma vivax]KAH8611838.1 IQ calmodulin binding motif [Trypanosoma vivax]CCC50381.1 conserved hypothetical protein [Trypanosoma vivax Y486]